MGQDQLWKRIDTFRRYLLSPPHSSGDACLDGSLGSDAGTHCFQPMGLVCGCLSTPGAPFSSSVLG